MSPKAKAGLGVGFMAWGLVGLLATDPAEAKLGLSPSEQDKAELERLKPKFRVVDREQRS